MGGRGRGIVWRDFEVVGEGGGSGGGGQSAGSSKLR